MLLASLATTAIVLFAYRLTYPDRLVISNAARARESLRVALLIVLWGTLLNALLPAPDRDASRQDVTAFHEAP